MNELALNLLIILTRTTVLLAVAAGVVSVLLWVTRCSSARTHRLAWCLVLLQGWILIRLPVVIPCYDMSSKTDRESEPPTDSATDGTALVPAGTGSARIDPSKTRHLRQVPVASCWSSSLPLAALWLAGMGAMVVWWSICYVRFFRRLPPGQPAEESWVRQWEELLASRGVRRKISVRVTNRLGPLLCRLPGGYQLLIPAALWRELTEAGRLTLLRHELAHYQRGDHWKSVAVRLMALPHWFNPVAWLVVQRFDDCAEWACDERATHADPSSAMEYAQTLLRLGDPECRPPLYGSAARGNGLSVRIRRLLCAGPLRDSPARRGLVVSGTLALTAVCLIRVDLVAKEPATEGSTPAADAQDNRFLDAMQRRQRAVDRIRKLAGELHRLPSDSGEQAYDVVLNDTAVTDRDLIYIQDLGEVRSLSLANTRITDAGLVHLKDLTSLEYVDLTGTNVTDVGIVHLKGLSRLQSLGVGDTAVTGVGLAKLEEAASERLLRAGVGAGGFGGGMGGVMMGNGMMRGGVFGGNMTREAEPAE